MHALKGRNKVLGFLALLTLGACSLFRLSTLEYNNRVTVSVNDLNEAILAAETIYETSVPAEVNENSVVSTSEMARANRSLRSAYTAVESTLTLRSEDPQQEASLQPAVTAYLKEANLYLSKFESTLEFYQDKAFTQEPYLVSSLDQELKDQFRLVSQKNTELSSLLESFQQ